MPELETVLIETVTALRDWLLKNHHLDQSFWLVRWKKGSGNPYLEYDDIVDQLICFGWVDSLPRKLSHQQSLLRISPRNPKSNWSAVNKKRVSRLSQLGLMHPAGIRLVNLAKENGAWDFLDDVDKLIVPEDLANAFSRYPNSEYHFNRFPASSKRGILEWIKNARTIATRTKRLEETALKASMNVKANHPRGRDAGPSN